MSLPQDPGTTALFAPVTPPVLFSRLGVVHMVRLGDLADADEAPPTLERCTVALPDAMAAAVPKRVRSFLAGRHCAARALKRFSGQAPDVGRGAHGEPLWPAGIIGSITHSDAYAGAIVAAASQYRGIGIDCERIISASTCDEIAKSVVPELASIDLRDAAAQALSRELLVSIAFSAKESIFKCVFPLYGEYFDFPDVVIDSIDVAAASVRARLSPAISARARVGDLFPVHLALHPDQVFTAVRL